jgi:hypothetical protein
MTRRTRTLAIACLLLLLPGSAGAVVAQVWTETSLQFTNMGGVQASATATGVATLQTSSAASLHLSTITLTGQSLTAVIQPTDPSAAPVSTVVFDLRQRPDLQGGGVIGNLSGALGGEGALTPRTLPVTGGVTLCYFAGYTPCIAQLNLPLGATSASLRIGQGVGGLLTIGGTGTIRISLVGAPYTVDTVSAVARTPEGLIEVHTAQGFAHGPASSTSSTAQTSGVLQIVTATHTTVVGPGDKDLSGMLSHTLVHIVAVPEPGLLLLFLSGAGFVALLGVRRRGRS